MARLFGFVTPETLYSVPERKAKTKNVIIQIRKLNLLRAVFKKKKKKKNIFLCSVVFTT